MHELAVLYLCCGSIWSWLCCCKKEEEVESSDSYVIQKMPVSAFNFNQTTGDAGEPPLVYGFEYASYKYMGRKVPPHIMQTPSVSPEKHEVKKATGWGYGVKSMSLPKPLTKAFKYVFSCTSLPVKGNGDHTSDLLLNRAKSCSALHSMSFRSVNAITGRSSHSGFVIDTGLCQSMSPSFVRAPSPRVQHKRSLNGIELVKPPKCSGGITSGMALDDTSVSYGSDAGSAKTRLSAKKTKSMSSFGVDKSRSKTACSTKEESAIDPTQSSDVIAHVPPYMAKDDNDWTPPSSPSPEIAPQPPCPFTIKVEDHDSKTPPREALIDVKMPINRGAKNKNPPSPNQAPKGKKRQPKLKRQRRISMKSSRVEPVSRIKSKHSKLMPPDAKKMKPKTNRGRRRISSLFGDNAIAGTPRNALLVNASTQTEAPSDTITPFVGDAVGLEGKQNHHHHHMCASEVLKQLSKGERPMPISENLRPGHEATETSDKDNFTPLKPFEFTKRQKSMPTSAKRPSKTAAQSRDSQTAAPIIEKQEHPSCVSEYLVPHVVPPNNIVHAASARAPTPSKSSTPPIPPPTSYRSQISSDDSSRYSSLGIPSEAFIDNTRFRYEYLDKKPVLIGKGKTGHVYLGKFRTEQGSVKSVCIKNSLKPDLQRILYEYKCLDMLRLTGCVPYPHGILENDPEKSLQRYGLVMEFIGDGLDLLDLVRKQRMFPITTWASVAVQLVHALKQVHNAGILLNDLKPANVMTAPLQNRCIRIVLIDFSHATIDSGLHYIVPREKQHKVRHLAPEVVHGQRTNVESDIYSLGAVLEFVFNHAKVDGGWTKHFMFGMIGRCCMNDNPIRRPTIEDLTEMVTKFARDVG